MVVDRESAYELLLARVAPPDPEPAREREPERGGRVADVLGSGLFRSFARAAASTAGREIVRSLCGTAMRTRRRSSPRRRSTRGDW